MLLEMVIAPALELLSTALTVPMFCTPPVAVMLPAGMALVQFEPPLAVTSKRNSH